MPSGLRWLAPLALTFLVACGGDADDGRIEVDPPPAAPDATPWSVVYGSIENELRVPRLKVAVDGSGNVALAGFAAGEIDFGGTKLASSPQLAGFVVKFDPKGELVWSHVLTETRPYDVAFDGAGSVIVAGALLGQTDFGGGSLAPADEARLFLVKLDGDGKHLWSQRFGPSDEYPSAALTVKDGGEILLAATMTGTADVGGGPLPASAEQAILAQFSADGEHAWSRRLPNGFYVDGLTVDRTGHVLVSLGHMLLKLDAGGDTLWIREFDGASGDTRSNRVACDAEGNVLVTGMFTDTLRLGDLRLQAHANPPLESGARDYEGFIAKLDPSGVPLWAERFGDGNFARGMAVAAVGDEIALAGTFNHVLDLGGRRAPGADCSTGFAYRLDATGKARWGNAYINNNALTCLVVEDMVMSGTTNPVMVGFFGGDVDFGAGRISTGLAGFGWSIFIAKLPR
ncbi:hypothetical protein [Chondromyces crocatus]|uniref:Lipoprotein n=1 Tax=Chondromyces crocatus TaxID=52 RepID=A0A0K1EQV8_CHOCO|nr:hypothetical protein [Chondromyces crocatus]AKT43310.1 uncharacterized protein CMC5_075420 [Chondromyces crocatus]